MKSRCLSLLAAALLGAYTPESSSQAAAPDPKPEPKGTSETAKAEPLPYHPLVRGGPVVRTGNGGTRGSGGNLPALYVLAPEREGETTKSQPTLFWFQSAPAKADFEIAVTELKSSTPLIKRKIIPEQKAGIHFVSLARQGKPLEPNVSYKWSIAIVVDPASRSKDVVASGRIKRTEAPAALAARIEQASQAKRAAIYAEKGYWYDALESISHAIADDPANAALHRLRASLLEKEKLKEAAAAESR